MPQRAIGDGANIVARNVNPVVQKRADFAADDKRLRAPRAGAVSDVLVVNAWAIWRAADGSPS